MANSSPRRKSKRTDQTARWAQLLNQSLFTLGGPPAGEGWKNVSDLVAETGRLPLFVTRFVLAQTKAGKMETKQFRTPRGQTCNYYRPV